MPIRFPWTPDFGAQAPHQPRVRSVQFGDGYRQDQEDGLNIDLPAWEVQFSNRSKAEADGIEAFLRARRGVDRFWFKLPDSDFSVTGHGFGVGDNATVTFQLQRTRVGTFMDALGTYALPTVPRTNLLTYSGDFSNAAWVSYFSKPTVYATIGPDGALNAWRFLTADGSGNRSGVYQTSANAVQGPVTVSVWARCLSGTLTCKMGVTDLDETTITLTTTWQRFTYTSAAGVVAGGRMFQIYESTASNTAWETYGPQVEAGSTATPYIPTTSAAVTRTPSYYPSTTDGFEPVTEPGPDLAIYRKDWQGNQQMYPWARTNLCPRSVPALAAAGYEFSGTAGTNSTGPDGTTSAMTFATGASTSDIFAPITAAAQAAGAFTASCWVLPTEADSVEFLRVDNASSAQVGAGNTVPTLTPGVWQVVSVTTTNPSSQTLRPHIRIKTGRTCRVAEFQLEVGSAATSRIPTAGTAASRTDYTLGTAGAVTFAVAPLTNAILTWSGSGADWRLVTCKRWTPAIGQTWKISATFQQEVA